MCITIYIVSYMYIYFIEPVISNETNQIESEVIINYNYSIASSGEIFIIDLPVITVTNGPFR